MASIIAIIVAYLLGSLSTSIILSKVMQFNDPRTEGSGNAGATNVLRNFGKNKAAMVLLGDVVKGLIAVMIGRMLGVQGFALALVAVAAVIGHVYPVFFGFKGGKGVATALGSILGLSFAVGLIAMIAWAAIAYITKYASLASLVAVVASPVMIIFLSRGAYFIPVLAIAALIVWQHWDNIQRLQSGTESKIQL